jgi:AAA+ superfamily predicted ATPase
MHAQVFLTTNLLSTIDNAFRSRVNIHLLFDSLSPSSRRQLWQKFMERLPKEEKKKKLSAKDLKELAKWELNGREIKNSIKTVRNWCIVKDLEMNLERLESGIKNTTPQATKVDEDDSSVPASKRKRGSVSKN